ncbi:MAG: SDR family oxidoreductase [Rhodospirillaceae bacterium]|nr:SDR family oxidoreductase [Rhodospirillaceae bacterium]MBT6117204.1 SDR family oxidoreductase [Rhodospirillaceae bacterium]
MAKPLDGRLALVTGATRGLGRAIAERLRDDGARVIGTGTRPDGEAPDGCEFMAVDFTDRAATEAFGEKIRVREPLILVNNAGIGIERGIEDLKTEEFLKVHDINLLAPVILCRAAVPGMRKAGWGRILNIGSIYGTISRERRIPYSSTKFAIDGVTAALAPEVAKDGILVNTLAPGFIYTEMIDAAEDIDVPALEATIPIGRMAQPEEIAAFAAWLVGPENTYVSGSSLTIDGGLVRV